VMYKPRPECPEEVRFGEEWRAFQTDKTQLARHRNEYNLLQKKWKNIVWQNQMNQVS
jgi:hypothetical protein